MNAVIPHLTSALLVIHTMLGCCWHHAHACAGECGEATVLTAVVQEKDCIHPDECHLDADSPACDHGHRAPQGCQGDSCVFLGAPKRILHTAASPLVLPAMVCPAATGLSISAIPLGDASVILAPLPPVRLHLAHQVLLI